MAADADHPLFARLYDPVTWLFEQAVFPRHRRYLARDLSGTVLDLGAGTGAMFPYFADVDGATVHAVEPDPHMRRQAERAARDAGLGVALVDADASRLPYDDGAFDVVVASMVLCTVPEFGAALDEVARVLAPSGEFRFFEHVRADGVRGRLQDLAAPAWHRVAGGCHLNRETGRLVDDHPALDLVECTRLGAGFALVNPFVRGAAVRRP